MSKLIRVTLSIEILGILAFIVIANYLAIQEPYKLLLIIGVGMLALTSSVNLVNQLTIKELLLSAFVTSIMIVIFLQLLGFFVFSGLVKDIDAFSLSHLSHIGYLLLFGMLGHSLLFFIAKLAHMAWAYKWGQTP